MNSRDRIATASDKTAGLVTALLALAAVVLRWMSLSRQSLWLDEGFTAWVGRQSWRDIFPIVCADTAPPLHYLLQHLWILLWGYSETALRSLSALLGTLSLGMLYLLARRMLRDAWAVAAAVGLFGFSAFQIQYSQEVRFYALMMALALAGLWGVRTLLDRRRENRPAGAALALIVAATAAGLYTHNIMLFYWPLLDAAWLILGDGPPWRQRLRDLLWANAIIAVLYVPWIGFLIAQTHRVGGDFWIGRPALWQLPEVLSTLCGVDNTTHTGGVLIHALGFAGIHLHALATHSHWAGWPGRLLIAGILLAFLGDSLLRPTTPGRRRNVMALAVYAILPVLVLFIQSRLAQRPLLLDRTLIASSAPLAIILAAPLCNRSRRRIHYACIAGLALIFAGQAISIVGQWRLGYHEDWRSATADAGSLPLGPPRQVCLVFMAAEGELLFDYYAQANANPLAAAKKTGVPTDFFALYPPMPVHVVHGPQDLAGLRADLACGQWRYFVYFRYAAWFMDKDDLTLQTLRQYADLRQEHDFANGLNVYEFVAPPPNPAAAPAAAD